MNQEIKDIKSQLSEDIQNNVDYVDKSAVLALKMHKWASSKRFENDRVLDAYSLCLKDREGTKFYLKKIKACRSPEKLFSWLEEYSNFFEKIEKNLKNLTALIKKCV